MKIFLWLSLFLWISHKALPQGVAIPDSPVNQEIKTVLIFNSYHPETKWSGKIVSELQSALKQQFPDIQIFSGNLNIEENQTLGTSLLTTRAIIWQMAEQQGDTINPESRQINSLYKIKKLPDVIVCIGEEAYFEHTSLHLWQGEWSKIPIVCCALNDSIVRPFWRPEQPICLNQLYSVADKENRQIGYTPKSEANKKDIAEAMAEIGLRLSDKAEPTADGDSIYVTRYHVTGVVAEIPIRENLELIKQVMPNLEEMVWVDNEYYKSCYALYKLQQELPRILPGIKLRIIEHNRINTDSIFDAMLQPEKNRVFITYAWNINGIYSRRPERQVDSLFTNGLASPIISLTKRQENKNYWLGGAYLSTNSIVRETIGQIAKILNGIPVDSIPFVKVSQPDIHFNVPALKRFGLEKRAHEINGAIFNNIPPSFYQQHERAILVIILIVIILTGYVIMVIKRLAYTKKIQTEYINYQKLYQRLKTIYQNAAIDFAIYDKEGLLLTRIVAGQENTLIRNPKEILSQCLFTNPYLSEAAQTALHQKETVNEEIEIECSEKAFSNRAETKKWNLIIKPLNNSYDQKARYIAIAMDMTPLYRERKAKERTEHVFRFASETAQVGVASYNLLTGKGFASPTWYLNLNEEPEKDCLPTYRNVVEPDRKAILAYLQRIRKAYVPSPFIQIIRVKDQEGKIHYVQEYIFVREFAPERKVISIIEMNINYDAPKQKENELQLAKEQAELSNLETEQFLANISHEIRTPLNVIVGFSSILANSTDEEEIKMLTPIIEQNNNLLIALIDNILYLSKLDSGTLTFNYAPTEAKLLFDSLANYARKEAESKDIQVVVAIPPANEQLLLAETQFRLMMTNLISNAVKFTCQGTITIGYEQRKNEYYFFVQDTGCGIHISNQECIFKRFNKLDVFTQGTGLGLALCRSIVTHQGGEIGVNSTPGEGSTFWFTLKKGGM